MSLVVNHNLFAMNAARNLTTIYGRLGNSVQRLSSGLRVNSAADDAAGLAIRELMRADIAVLNQGIRNASDAISMIQTAEGAMSVIDEKLIRMKELAEQSSTGTYTTAQREIMDSEFQAMAAEVDRIANATDFNGVKLLDGSLEQQHNGSGMKIHFGTGNASAEDYYYVGIGDMRATEATGLRIGNSDIKDVWTSASLDKESANSVLGGASTTGTFGIQVTTDGGTTWSTYGYMTVDADDTLANAAAEIAQGSVQTATLSFGAVTSTLLDGKTMTINGHVFTFDATDTTQATTGSATTIGLKNIGTAATIILAVERAINDRVANGDSAVDAIAQRPNYASGTTIVLYHEEFGTPTGTTNLSLGGFTGATTMAINANWTSRDLGMDVGAKAALADSSGYELQLTASRAGDNYQIRIINTTGDVINNTGSGVTLSQTSGLTLAITGGNLADFALLDEATEWEETANGSGTTTWDGADILTQSGSQAALAAIDTAINKKDTARANMGAIQNRLENTITNLQIQAENLQAAESRISDVDVALEMTEFTRNNILAQAAVAMLAQANSLPSLALSLLGG